MPHLLTTLQRRFAPVSPLTRREMIQRSLAAAAGLLLSSREVEARYTAPLGRAIVVGAGLAGLAAAFELKAAGFDVHVLEARNRLGGRVLTFHDFVPGKHVEGGGELVGANHPVWLAYRDRFGLQFLDIADEDLESPIAIDGRRLSSREAEQLWKGLDAACARMNEPARAIADPHAPWTAANAHELDARSLADWTSDQGAMTPLGRRVIVSYFAALNGVEAGRQSLLGLLAMIAGGGVERYWTESEVFRCAGGNQSLAERLASAVGSDRVHLRTPVRRIESTERGVRVITADMTRREADVCVLAVPPSTWHRLTIDPPLPRTLAPQMGANVKYLMALDADLWKSDGVAAECFSDGPVNTTWDQTQGQPGAGTSLVAFSGADDARTCRSWAPAERDSRYRAALEPLYPAVARSIRRARFMDWPGDPWTAGSYSFPAPGELTASGALLQQPHGRVYLAGEHTSPAFPGYMEGALQSGTRVAKQIVAASGMALAAAAIGNVDTLRLA